MSADSLRRLPFDHYARYRLAADIVEATRRGVRQRVLDVGGGPGSLQAFLPDDEVVASDLNQPTFWHEAAPSLVLADGGRLPFPDRAFDVVVTLDTLEHVPAEQRRALLTEVVRVSRGWILVACPCATPGVAEADAALLSLVRAKFGEEFETVSILQEHLGFGHPDPERILKALRDAGGDAVQFPSGRLDRWLPMMVLFFHLMAMGRDDPVERVQAWYNGLFYRDDLRAPSYRQAFLVKAPGADGPAPEDVVAGLLPEGPSLTADVAAFEAMRQGLTEELVAVVESANARAGELEREVGVLSERAATLQERAVAAEQQAAVLEMFRQEVLAHPLVRIRGRVKRLFRAM